MENIWQNYFNFDNFLIFYPNVFFIFVFGLIVLSFYIFRNFKIIPEKIKKCKKLFLNFVGQLYSIIKTSPILESVNKGKKFLLFSVKKILIQDQILLFIVILLLIIFSRFSISYSDAGLVLVPPEKHFMLTPIGVDFYLATIKPAINIIRGENFYYYTANYGPSFSLFAIPFIFTAKHFNYCSLTDYLSCSHILYKWFIAITIIGYSLFILFFFKKLRNLFLLFLISFLFGVPGSLGLERGNIDIFFSLLLGFLILLISKSWSRSKTYLLSPVVSSFIIGIISGFISSSKIFFIPFALIGVIAAKNVKIAFFSLIFTFVGFSYLPNFFGSKSDIYDPFKVAMVFDKYIRFGIGGSININHSFSSFLSIISDCVYNQTCDRGLSNSYINLFSFGFLFISVFVLPFLPLIKITYKFIKTKSFLPVLKIILLNLYDERKNIKLILILFVLADAAINLLPTIAYDYRLFYSLFIIFFLFNNTRKNSKANFYCILSMIFFLLKGLWIFTNLNAKGMSVFEARGMNIFVILHFYFLIKSALENYKENFYLNIKNLIVK